METMVEIKMENDLTYESPSKKQNVENMSEIKIEKNVKIEKPEENSEGKAIFKVNIQVFIH